MDCRLTLVESTIANLTWEIGSLLTFNLRKRACAVALVGYCGNQGTSLSSPIPSHRLVALLLVPGAVHDGSLKLWNEMPKYLEQLLSEDKKILRGSRVHMDGLR
ncbi:hypothetical protein LINPERHAP1_LOCUS34303 [Linum perenne]